MALGRRDIDVTSRELLAVLCKRRRQSTRLGQDGIKRRAELARKVNGHENGSGKIMRELTGEETQCLEPPRGGADSENVAVCHATERAAARFSSTASAPWLRHASDPAQLSSASLAGILDNNS